VKSQNAGRALGAYLESVVLAILFGLASVAPVALYLQAGPDQHVIEAVGWLPLGTGQAFALALGAVIPAAILGGAVGGLVWLRRAALAPVAALTVAWFVGIAALPVIATWFDLPLRAGVDCFVSCTVHLRDGQPGGGVTGYAESLVGLPLTIYLFIVPAVLFLVARRTRQPAVWVAAWLTLHAAIHPFSILRAAPIYAVLLVGVVLWSAWLWLRDAQAPRLRGRRRRWAVAIVPAAAIIATTWAAVAFAWVPAVPVAAQGARIGTATVEGFNPPDPNDWFPQILEWRTPAGSGCFDPVVRPAGRLDICWEAYRDNREHLPGADYYQFRLVATLQAKVPETWVDISIIPVGDERTRPEHIWPSGVLDGPCRSAAVEGMDFLTDRVIGEMTDDVARDHACGRTTGARVDGRQRHRVIWTCAGCGADQPGGRQIAVRELTVTSQGNVPSWEVYAELGS
jgi:hypothetical protein